MPLTRQIEPELLDHLPANDPGAVGSRHDLQRLNSLMGHVGLMTRLLRANAAASSMSTLVELGAGDGNFLSRVAGRIGSHARGVKAIMIDLQGDLNAQTRQGFEDLGWSVEAVISDVFVWLAKIPPQTGTAIIANLFLHHFSEAQLRNLLSQVALKADWFAACEPRRSLSALGMSRLLGLIGCNSVTRHDAVISVRAGFLGNELSKLWPPGSGWWTAEGEAGLFSHTFAACRREKCP